MYVLTDPPVQTESYSMTNYQKRLPFNPVRVKDPISECHTVYLRPDQTFEVYLSDNQAFRSADIQVQSDYLKIDKTFPAHGGRIIRFSQVSDLNSWGKISTTYLGEVIVKAEQVSKLCVYLEASNPYKKNIITVINPNNHLVKIHPYQVLEVVVSNPVWGTTLYWDVDVSIDNRFELLAHSYIQPQEYDPSESVRRVNDAFFTYPRHVNENCRPYLEYHFWLRCKVQIAKLMQTLPSGMFPNGQIRFVGYISEQEKVSHDLNIIFNTRSRTDPTSERVQTVTFSDSDMTKDVQLTGKKSTGNDIIPLQELIQSGNNALNTTQRWNESYHKSGYSGKWPQQTQQTSYNKTNYINKWGSVQKYEVRRNTEPLWAGCTIKYLDDITTGIYKP